MELGVGEAAGAVLGDFDSVLLALSVDDDDAELPPLVEDDSDALLDDFDDE